MENCEQIIEELNKEINKLREEILKNQDCLRKWVDFYNQLKEKNNVLLAENRILRDTIEKLGFAFNKHNSHPIGIDLNKQNSSSNLG